MSNVLALDLATKTGWAWRGPDGEEATGMENFRKRTGESQGMIFIRFQAWLNDFLKDFAVDLICYEQAHQRGRAATEMAGGLLGVLKIASEKHGIDFTSVHSSKIKKIATGKGNASKTAVMAAYKEKWGREPLDDNEADARWLLEYAVNEFVGRF